MCVVYHLPNIFQICVINENSSVCDVSIMIRGGS